MKLAIAVVISAVSALLVSSCATRTLVSTPIVVMMPIMPLASSCDTGGFPQPAAGSGGVTIPPGFNGGILVGESAHIQAPIQLVEGGMDLLIIVKDDLIVSADILFPATMQQRNSASLNITLVSIEGKVRIDPEVTIGEGEAAKGGAGNRNVASGTGVNGGEVRMIGQSLEIEGRIIGNDGGVGGEMVVVTPGAVSRNAATGGRGGNIVLCALDVITAKMPQGAQLQAAVESGAGGNGGKTDINPTMNLDMDASGVGGNGGNAGDIHLIGTDQGGANMQISNDLKFWGSFGGDAGAADVDAGSFANNTGKNAEARGGIGGAGGTVLFLQCEHSFGGGDYAAGQGGTGGVAEAYGNKGVDAAILNPSGPGGNAQANGGQGGQKGADITVPLPNNRSMPGTRGTYGPGRAALAVSGTGGDGFPIVAPLRGPSPGGRATASGGSNGRGQTMGAPRIFGPNPPRMRGRGGPGARASQRGRP